jgi:hypothetical protein
LIVKDGLGPRPAGVPSLVHGIGDHRRGPTLKGPGITCYPRFSPLKDDRIATHNRGGVTRVRASGHALDMLPRGGRAGAVVRVRALGEGNVIRSCKGTGSSQADYKRND